MLSEGSLTVTPGRLQYTPDDNAARALDLCTEDIDWVKRAPHNLVVKPAGEAKMNLAAIGPHLNKFVHPRRFGSAKDLGIVAVDMPERLLRDGIEVRQHSLLPNQEVLGHPDTPRWSLLLLVYPPTILMLMIATVGAPIAAAGNLLGIDADSVPRSWMELLVEIGIFVYGASYFLFARKMRPRWSRWQVAMGLGPFVGYCSLMLYLVLS